MWVPTSGPEIVPHRDATTKSRSIHETSRAVTGARSCPCPWAVAFDTMGVSCRSVSIAMSTRPHDASDGALVLVPDAPQAATAPTPVLQAEVTVTSALVFLAVLASTGFLLGRLLGDEFSLLLSRRSALPPEEAPKLADEAVARAE